MGKSSIKFLNRKQSCSIQRKSNFQILRAMGWIKNKTNLKRPKKDACTQKAKMSLVNPLNQMMKLYKSSLAREKQAAAVSHRHTMTDRGSSVSFVLCPIMKEKKKTSALTSLFCILIFFPECRHFH